MPQINVSQQIIWMNSFMQQKKRKKTLPSGGSIMYRFLLEHSAKINNNEMIFGIKLLAMSSGYPVDKAVKILTGLRRRNLFTAFDIDENNVRLRLKNLDPVYRKM